MMILEEKNEKMCLPYSSPCWPKMIKVKKWLYVVKKLVLIRDYITGSGAPDIDRKMEGKKLVKIWIRILLFVWLHKRY